MSPVRAHEQADDRQHRRRDNATPETAPKTRVVYNRYGIERVIAPTVVRALHPSQLYHLFANVGRPTLLNNWQYYRTYGANTAMNIRALAPVTPGGGLSYRENRSSPMGQLTRAVFGRPFCCW